MSVLVTVSVKGDVDKLRALAAANPQRLRDISATGKAAGAIHHDFYVADDGTVVVVDEWPNAEAFQGFFAGNAEIGQIMAEAGVTAAPEVRVLTKLDLGDSF